LVPAHSSSKNKKTALLLEDDIFPIDYRFGTYPPINGGVPSHHAKLDSESPVCFKSNRIQATFLATTGVSVKPHCEVSAIAMDKWATNNAMLNAWR